MTVGEKEGWETSNSKFCGVETHFSDDVPSLLSLSIDNGGFDFVLAPLRYKDNFLGKSNLDSRVSPTQWKTQVIGQVESLIDLDVEDEFLWVESEISLKQQVFCANDLSLRACLLPTPPPRGTSCANYARYVNQILQQKYEMELWLRIPLKKSQGEKDSWEIWNTFRLLCDHNSKLSVVLDVGSMLPSEESLERWFGEPVKAAILGTECFESTANGDAYLLKTYGELVTRFFQDSVQIIISGTALHHPQKDSGKQTPHPYRYLDSVRDLFHKMEPLSEKERIEVGLRDCLHTPVQPLKYNLDPRSYELLKRDSVKYVQYKRAIAKALKERFPNEKASELTTVLMVVGAGRGPLVMASMDAAEETGRKLKVYAVEKNPNAVIALRDLVQKRGWEGTVTVVSGDLRFWTAPERADILVSEMLGYFGDIDLSLRPEGGQSFLKPSGISIPSAYTSFIQPITSSKLYNDLKSLNSVSYFETAYAVKLHRVTRLAPFQPLFSFGYRYKKLHFQLPSDMGSALVHGFAGHVIVVLYDDVHLTTEPPTGWFPMFFPLMNPVEVQPDSPIEVHFWKCQDSKRGWYEWSLTSPTVSPIHNSFGSSYWIDL